MDKIGHEIKGYSGYSLKKAESANTQQLSPADSNKGNNKYKKSGIIYVFLNTRQLVSKMHLHLFQVTIILNKVGWIFQCTSWLWIASI